MTRALVLGGGGPVGIAWETGLVLGLQEEGVDVTNADLFVGTSAGSVVGAQLALGRTPRDMYDAQTSMAERVEREQKPVDMQALIAQFTTLFTSDKPMQELRAAMGAFALQADTISEDEWLAGFGSLEGMDAEAWPSRSYACTAIDVADGSFHVWNNDSNVPLGRAVASSCAVPGIFPPVTINGRRYMDGGIGSATNAQVARGYDTILVVSVTSARPAAVANNPILERMRKRFDDELNGVREAGGKVDLIQPNAAFAETFGANLMDFTRRTEAADMGLTHGREEAHRLRAFWS